MRLIKYLTLALALLWAMPALADQPLLQNGKKTVFQRVVSHPGAVLYKDETASSEQGRPLTFTSFYVYERKGDMARVGTSATRSDGWLKVKDFTEWPQAITMEFTDNMGRSPVIFFKDHNAVVDLCQSDNIGGKVDGYINDFKSGKGSQEVLALEPAGKEGSVSQRNFYLMPVLNTDDQFKDAGTQLLQVACIDPGNPDAAQAGSAGQGGAGSGKGGSGKGGSGPGNKGAKQMKTGIAFVVDTTKSMGPYIEKTKELIRNIYDELENSPQKDNVELALVAFRSNPDLRPKTEYNSKIISDFKPLSQRGAMEAALKEAEECQASTHAFDEDSLAGVQQAIEGLSWDGLDGKTILLVTDAGPLGAGDPAGSTGMSPESMAALLKSKGMYATVAHIKGAGKQDKADHSYAERSYKTLAMMGNGRASYVPIDAHNPKTATKSFGDVGKILADRYRSVVELTARGQMLEKPKEQDLPKSATPEERARQAADAIGYAMQLQFLGNQNKTGAPQVVSAWIADSDLPNLEKNPDDAPVPAAWPAVLLTKAQLSQLRQQLKLIIEKAQEAFLAGNENFNFYEQLISAAAQMTRDPSSFSSDPDANLAQKGVLLEVLDGLPYKSQILRMKQEDWTNMSTGEQQEFIKRLGALLKYYDKLDSSSNEWEGFGSPNTNEWVARVPLRYLP